MHSYFNLFYKNNFCDMIYITLNNSVNINEEGDGMEVFNYIYDGIGNTKIVHLPILDIPVYAKLELQNPGGSIKDRAALYMITRAEQNKKLSKGGVIIEASSGNQGAAAAMIGNAKGYKTIVTMSEKVSIEKQSVFKAYGAEIVLCKPSSDFNDPLHYYQVAKKLAQDTPGSYFLNQYFNLDNSDAHYYGIAPEIDRQIGDHITHIFVALGSCGTGNGIARYMKEYRAHIKVIGVDSVHGFLATNGNPKPYYLDGMGVDYQTPFWDLSLFHDIVNIEDKEAHDVLKMLSRSYGMLVGPSSGGAVAGVLRYKDKFTKNDSVLTLFCDSGRNYLSKNYYS
jgi:cystathionine beta-synthase